MRQIDQSSTETAGLVSKALPNYRTEAFWEVERQHAQPFMRSPLQDSTTHVIFREEKGILHAPQADTGILYERSKDAHVFYIGQARRSSSEVQVRR